MNARKRHAATERRVAFQNAAIAYADARQNCADDPQSFKYETALSVAWAMLESTARRYVEAPTDA